MKLLASLLLLFVVSTALGEERKPNIIYLLADDLGYGEVGCYGPKEIPTPNIDSLASNGVRFTSGYAAAPSSSPSRAGLLTGRYPQRFGLEADPAPAVATAEGFGLPTTEKTIGDRLKELGYATGWIGKSHLGATAEFHPMKRGFDEFFGFLGADHPYQGERGRRPDNPLLRGTEKVTETEYLTTAFGREAVSFIDRHKDEPFFLYVAFNAVHSPLQSPKTLQARFKGEGDAKRRVFCGMLTALDEAIGAVLNKLRDAKLEENTLIVFLSGNGGPTLQTTCRNTPLRGYKDQTLEGGIRVPFLLQWKAKLPEAKVVDYPVSSLDLLPTAVVAAGGEPEADWKLDGVNLLPYLNGNESGSPHETLYWRMGEQAGIRQGDWKLVRFAIGRAAREISPWELYNLTDDTSEGRNLATEEPERLKELEAAWAAWSAQLGTPKWTKSSTRTRRKAPRKPKVEATKPATPIPSKGESDAPPTTSE